MTNSMGKTRSFDHLLSEALEAVDVLSRVSLNSDTETDRVSDTGYLDEYLEILNRLCDIFDEMEFAGLQQICLVCRENFHALHERGKQLDEQLLEVLKAWPEFVRNYLESPWDIKAGQALISYLQLPVWETPLPPQDAEMIEILLEEECLQAAADDHAVNTLTDVEKETIGGDQVACASTEPMGTKDSRLHFEQSATTLEATLPPQIREMVQMLIEEIPLMEEPLLKLIEIEPVQDPLGWEAAAEVYGDYLERFSEATEAVGFLGLQQLVIRMRDNLGILIAQGRALTPNEWDLLIAWSGISIEYLNSPYSASTCQDLVKWLQAPLWPLPLSEEESAVLLPKLQSPDLPEVEEEEVEVRPQQATPEDVRVELPDDANPDLLNALLQELPEQTETFSRAIQNLIGGGSQEDVQVAQRMAHTLKGAANTVGVTGLPTLTHHLEDILVALTKHQVLPTRSLALTLMNAADCLEAMGEALCGIGDPPDNALEVFQDVLDWANRIDREGLPEQMEDVISSSMEAPVNQSSPVTPQAVSPQESTLQNSPSTAKAHVTTGLVDDLLRLGGETIILGGQVHEQVRQIEERIRTMQIEFERLQQLGSELERFIDIKDLNTNRYQQQQYSDFDSLEMDQYSELHTTSRMLVETATDARQIGGIVTGHLQRLDKMLLTQDRLNREIQETVLSARMVPIKTVVPRLQRSVRQTCRLTGKQVELHISGIYTLMDSEVLSELVDPLMHILRNAVDHGIEPSAERVAAGKPEGGNIWLDFLREGNSILVRCRDDGAGFDFAAIRRTAERHGLLEPGQAVAEEELKRMLLMPNFSTRSEVSQTSGRGVGLDVVYSHIISQGGSLDLNTIAGDGSTTELRLPVSLISTHALLVRMQNQVVAVADRGIVQILHASDGIPRELGGEAALWVDEQIYPLKPLEEILQLTPDQRVSHRAPMPVLLVSTRSGVIAVQVQEILAGTDLVVKEFGRHVPRPHGIIGATILGDGAVTPVLDLPELMSDTRRHGVAETVLASEIEQEVGCQPIALVADDSLSARKALVQVMEDAGYEVRAARDGMEAVEVVELKRPDIVLADMEMPRMNGIELTAHLRAHPETAELPVIMITSRSTAKHRRQAKVAGVNVYLTKPFLDDELLDHVAALRGQL